MKFVALKELPQGQQPGDIFEATEAEGEALGLVEAARPATPAEIKKESKREYQRRDMVAEGE